MIPVCDCSDCTLHAARKAHAEDEADIFDRLQRLIDSLDHGDLKSRAERLDTEAGFGLALAGEELRKLVKAEVVQILDPGRSPAVTIEPSEVDSDAPEPCSNCGTMTTRSLCGACSQELTQ